MGPKRIPLTNDLGISQRGDYEIPARGGKEAFGGVIDIL